MHITIIAGARPNFMKIAPLIHAIQKKQDAGYDIQYSLVHTGQHYDEKMSGTFFKELLIPQPDVNLNCGGGTQAEQAAAIMVKFEKYLTNHPTNLVLVVGDVTSTMACSIVAKKLQTKIAHIEAGIRSFDLSMPEEINRMVTDSITDYFFTTSKHANNNLANIGVSKDKIFFVGNVMIDTLLSNLSRLKKPKEWDALKLLPQKYIVLTLHRPNNVDEYDHLKKLLVDITSSVHQLPVVFPIHPRTEKIVQQLDINAENLYIIPPQGYLEFNYLVKHSKAVITDSGGITEETTVMHIPCITLRDNTERPETCEIGTNTLVGSSAQTLKPTLERIFSNEYPYGEIPQRWDGNTSTRIIEIIYDILN